jgi:dihydrofolate synthase / folylpolyglutamate synthase
LRSLEEWLAHQERVHPRAIDLGLERLERVLERLGWKQPAVPVITVAGTNGKGSVVAFSTAILRAAGYRVGTFTSPHLRSYRERIRVDGALVGEAPLVRAFERIEEARGSGARAGAVAAEAGRVDDGPGAVSRADGPISLTFFEYNALAAFLVFEAADLDAWVLEIGMGGRLDAVNVVDPSVAVVVSIGLDHQEFLGGTLEAIALEKAGIFRAGTPAVLGSREMPEALGRHAQALGAPRKRLGQEYDFSRQADGWRYRGTRWDLPDLPAPALAGDIQFANAAAALAALEELEPRLRISAAAVARGLLEARLTARFQLIGGRPNWILDVAHNPDAARVLARNLKSTRKGGRTLAVCGILADKDAGGVAAELGSEIDEWWLVATHGARGTSGDELAARMAPHLRGPVHVCADIAAGCAEALAAARGADRIVVFGSFHTVAPAIDWLEARGLLPPEALPEYTEPPRP